MYFGNNLPLSALNTYLFYLFVNMCKQVVEETNKVIYKIKSLLIFLMRYTFVFERNFLIFKKNVFLILKYLCCDSIN